MKKQSENTDNAPAKKALKSRNKKANRQEASCSQILTDNFLHSFFLNTHQENLFELFSRTIEHSPVAIMITDSLGIIEYVNPPFAKLSQCSAASITGQRLIDCQHTCLSSELYENIWNIIENGRTQSREFKARAGDGSSLWHTARLHPVLNHEGSPVHFILFLENITQQKDVESLLDHMTHYDSLTDLPNRRLFNLHLEKAIENANQSKTIVCVGLLGLDRFKTINNTLGHGVGDTLIQLVGKRLSNHLSGHDTIARMGGDEYILMLTGIHNFREISEKANQLMTTFSKPFTFDSHELYVKASMGLSLFPEDGFDPLSLLKNADAALNDAKLSGRNVFKFYTPKLNATAREALSMETDLRRAIDKDELRLFYQPQVHLQTGKIVGMEALIRWQHPTLGLLGPDKFIPMAEETGMIISLGHWVLRTASLQVQQWHKMGFPDLRVAVNLSARQFQQPELVESILGICKNTGLDPKYLELEITESIFMKDMNITNMILQWFYKKGITIAIDDFGTGYSSLTYLKRFPIKTLKIDRSFIKDCLVNPDDAAIVSTITSIAHNLNMAITAEGVEEVEQLNFLRNLGCDTIQGFLFSKPVPADEFTAMLTQGRSLSDYEK